MTSRDRLSPSGELVPAPLEPVVSMTELARRQSFEECVVLRVRRRDDHGAGLRLFEHHTLERVEAEGIEVFDNLDQRCRVVTLEAPVTVDQRALEETDAAPLVQRQAVELQPARRDLENPLRDVDADNLFEAPVVDEEAQEPTFTAAEVEDPACPKLLQRGEDSRKALSVQADPLLDPFLLLRVPNLVRVGVELVLLRESGEGIVASVNAAASSTC